MLYPRSPECFATTRNLLTDRRSRDAGSSVNFGVRPNVMTPFDAIQLLPLFTQLRTCSCIAPTVAMGQERNTPAGKIFPADSIPLASICGAFRR